MENIVGSFLQVFGQYVDLSLSLVIAFICAMIYKYIKIENDIVKTIIPIVLGLVIVLIIGIPYYIGLASGFVATAGTAWIIEMLKKLNNEKK